MLWEVKTVDKKCVYMRTHYIVPSDSEIAADKTFYIDEMYRWGRCVIRSNEAPVQSKDPYSDPFDLGNYTIEDQESDDGCSLDFEFEEDDEWTDEEKQYITDLWDEDSWSAFYERGIESTDCDTQYVGPLEIICIDDAVDPEPEKPHGSDVKAAWPFSTY